MPVLTCSDALQAIESQRLPKSFVLLADVGDPMVYIIAGFMNICTWLASPPCQPWSRAGWLKGLTDPQGSVFATFLFWTGVCKVKCLNLENVPGLPDHEHYRALRDVMSKAGFHLVLSSRDKALPVLPIMRVRWLATCVRKDVLFSDQKLSMANSLAFPKSLTGIGEQNSIGLFGCVQNELQSWEVLQCVPDASVLEILGNPEFLPVNWRGKDTKSLSLRDVLKLRIRDETQPLPNVMAAQGSQHLLPKELLSEKGLYSFLLKINECLRFATPFEICSAMGFPSSTALPDVFQDAWHMVGNALAVPQAAIQCLRAWVLLGENSGFAGKLRSVADLCEMVLAQKCNLSDFLTTKENGIMSLKPKRPVAIAVATTIEDSSEDEIHDCQGSSPAKRICVSPTWQCMHEEPTLVPELNRDECPDLATMTVGTKTVQTGELPSSG
jgi:hypothetical protein